VLQREAGYFDVSTDLKPLMHLWSLAIEEQFYLVFPLAIWLCWRLRVHVLALVAAAGLLSFAANLHAVHADPVGAFFSPLTRWWQLMAGAALAWFSRRSDWSERAKAGASALGCTVLAAAFFLMQDKLYPGWQALAPVVGTVLLIAAGPWAWVNRVFFSHRAAVWLGQISYPLYLWHWTLLSLAHIVSFHPLDWQRRLAIVALSVLLAALTSAWIEKPIRYGSRWRGQKAVALTGVLAAVGLGGLLCFVQAGFPSRTVHENDDRRAAAVNESLEKNFARCKELLPHWMDTNRNPCALPAGAAPSIAVIGDSHAGHLYPGLAESFGDTEGIALFPAACAAPFVDVASSSKDPMRADNDKLMNGAIDYALGHESVRVVVLAHKPDCSAGSVIDVEDPSNRDSVDVLRKGMRRTLARLAAAGKRVVLVLDNPVLDFDPATCAGRPVQLSAAPAACAIPRRLFDADGPRSAYRKLVREVVADYPQASVFDAAALFCDDQICAASKEGRVLYQDRNHLNLFGSELVAKPLSALIRTLLRGQRPNPPEASIR
jgi:hypothetical protein